jgi:REP-associated tyrosine transposase
MTNPKLLRGRASEVDAYFAVTVVVHNRRPQLQEAGAAQAVIAEISDCHAQGRVESLAWVVMPDHFHWLFALRAGGLSDVVQTVKSRSARAINAAKSAQGQFWERGFYDHRLRGHEDLIAQASYIVANPLRGSLVTRLEDYPHWWCKWIERERDL